MNINTKTKKQREKELRKKYNNKFKKTNKINLPETFDKSNTQQENIQASTRQIVKPTEQSIIKPINQGRNFIMPNTDIIKYLFDNYQKYINVKRQRESRSEYPVTFDELFLFDMNSITNKLNLNLNTQVLQNPQFSLDKLMAYSIYTTSPYWLEDNINFLLEQYTNQIGKDLRRGDYIINNDNKYNREYFQSLMYNEENKNIKPQNEVDENDSNQYKQIDQSDFKLIANYYYNALKTIANTNNVDSFNDNLNNKLCLLSIQNINNFIFTNILGPWVSSLITPEQAFIVSADVINYNVVINISQISIEIHMKCKLLFSKDGILDPEIPFGDLDAKLFFDILNNTYKFSTLKISYDLASSLSPQTQTQTQTQTQAPSQSQSIMQNIGSTINTNPSILYGTAAAGITGALIALPFLLGGKSKRKRKFNKNKNKKTKKM